MFHRTLLACALAACGFPSPAQVPAPNASGVAMGHLHINARDVEAQRRFWTALGGTEVKLGTLSGVRFPGVLIFFRPVEPAGGTAGTVVGHLGFQVRSLEESRARWKAAGIETTREPGQGPTQTFVTAPDAIRVEISENPALTVPIAHHHIHFYDTAVDATKAWYVKLFGATPGKRGRFEAADLPGANLTFSEAAAPPAPTRGRALDHIGFEVRHLEAFCRQLQDAGVKLDEPYRQVPALGIAVAFLTDPWGTRIELTEGLAGR